jgi:hypothetical protein
MLMMLPRQDYVNFYLTLMVNYDIIYTKEGRCITMVNQERRDTIAEMYGDDTMVFDNPSFDNSIIGVSENGQVIYDYDSMVLELMDDDNIGADDAIDFIDYNTIRSLAY